MKKVISIIKVILLSFIGSVFISVFSACNPETITKIKSPDGKLRMTVTLKNSLAFSIHYKEKEIIKSSLIGMILSDQTLGENPNIKAIQTREVNESISPLYGKFKTLEDKYNETIIVFEDGYSLALRAYNEGMAYRFITDFDKEIIIENEIFNLNLSGNPAVLFPEASNYTSWELMYINYEEMTSILNGKKAITPVLFSMPENIKILIAESDVRNYPGMYLEKNGSEFKGHFAKYPDSTALGSWGFVSVVQRTKNYIAKTEGRREFPWRVIIVTDDDKELVTNELIYKLATPSVLNEDLSWIKPGKATWEWWHDAMLPGAEIPSGLNNRNTDLYKYYIDFAAENQLEYLMLDAGWSHIFDLSQVKPQVDIQEIINYGKSRNVGVFLWCSAMSLTDKDDEFLEMMHNWGAAGVKVDFFDRDDQLAMLWYETIAQKAAKYKLMVNFHGCSKPTGLQRTYPNIVNFEALRGEECSKWDLTANPQHHVTFPFIRMPAGPLDYTPGGMRNRSPQYFKPIDPGMPSVQGTRCHTLAMYVIYDQYLAMLCDSPVEYRKYPDIMKFLSDVPVTFDYTIVLDAKVGEYILMAKQKGNKWFIGAMTNWTARELTFDFSFLSKNTKYTGEIYKDGMNANLYADQYSFEYLQLNSNSKITIPLSAGGGTVLKIYPE